MYEKSYGYLYQELGEYPTTAAIARAIRADIKQATAEGLLPKRWTYSVRSRNFAGGCAVDVMVKDCPDAWQQCDGTVPGTKRTFIDHPEWGWSADPCGNVWCKAGGQYKDHPSASYHQVLTEEAMAAKMTLERIHNAYNHTGSDVQTDYFDVRYYGSVSFDRSEVAR